MIGEKELRLMKPSAILVNPSRGEVVDEEALARALREKWIAVCSRGCLQHRATAKRPSLVEARS